MHLPDLMQSGYEFNSIYYNQTICQASWHFFVIDNRNQLDYTDFSSELYKPRFNCGGPSLLDSLLKISDNLESASDFDLTVVDSVYDYDEKRWNECLSGPSS